MVSSLLLYNVHITSNPLVKKHARNMLPLSAMGMQYCHAKSLIAKTHNKRPAPPQGSKLPKAPIFASLSSLLLKGLRAPRNAISHGAPPTTHHYTPMHNHTHTLITSVACKRSITASSAPSCTHMRVRTYNQQATQCTYKGS